MSELPRILGAITTVAVGVSLVTSEFLNYLNNDKLNIQAAASVIQNWYMKNKHCLKKHQIRYVRCKRHSHIKNGNMESRTNPEIYLNENYNFDISQKQPINLLNNYFDPISLKKRIPSETYPSCFYKKEIIQKFQKSIWHKRYANQCPICWKKSQKYDESRRYILFKRVKYTIIRHLMSASESDHSLFGEPTGLKFNKCLRLVADAVKNEYAARMIQIWYQNSKIKSCFLNNTLGIDFMGSKKCQRDVIRDLMKCIAAPIIQNWFLQQQKRRYSLHYVHLHFSALYIQQWHKMKRKRQHMLHYVHLCAAVVAIQNWYDKRKKIAYFFQYANHYSNINLIENWYLNQKYSFKLQQHVELIKYAKVIKEWWKKLQNVKQTAVLDSLHRNALKIQIWFKNILNCMEILNIETESAALIIQNFYNTYKSRQSLLEYIYKYVNAMFIQQWYLKLRKRNFILDYLKTVYNRDISVKEELFDTNNAMQVSLVENLTENNATSAQTIVLRDQDTIKIIRKKITPQLSNEEYQRKQEIVDKNWELLKNAFKRYKAAKRIQEMYIKSKHDSWRQKHRENEEKRIVEVFKRYCNRCKQELYHIEREIAATIIQNSCRAWLILKEFISSASGMMNNYLCSWCEKQIESETNLENVLNFETENEENDILHRLIMTCFSDYQKNVIKKKHYDTRVQNFLIAKKKNSDKFDHKEEDKLMYQINDDTLSEKFSIAETSDKEDEKLDSHEFFSDEEEENSDEKDEVSTSSKFTDNLNEGINDDKNINDTLSDEAKFTMNENRMSLAQKCVGCQLITWFRKFKQIRNIRKYFIENQAAITIQNWYKNQIMINLIMQYANIET